MYPQALSRVLAVQPLLDAPARDQAGPRAAFEHLRIGQGVLARIVGQTRDMALVSIEGQTVAMRLPRNAERGETLRLSFAGHMPQPVFLLDAQEAEAAGAPQLSQTARMLSDIMQRVPERAPPTLSPTAPLLPGPAADTAELALALRTALVRSGLFYESHLAGWMAGRDSLEGLMREPQNRLATDGTQPAPGEPGSKGVHPLHALLTQQLQVLESPQFIWRGELWPGQTLEWQIERDAGDAPADRPASEGAADWESRLKLSLPNLGEIEVRIRLDAHQGFSIRLVPDSAASASLMTSAQGNLAGRLDAAGCILRSLEVDIDAGA